MNERLRFISKLLEGEKMAPLCRSFGISRKTGYKIWNRYLNEGSHAFTDRSSRPKRVGNKIPIQIENVIIRLKEEKPHWGAAKIREVFRRKYPDTKLPAKSTFHAVFERHGLVKHRKKRRYKAQGTSLSLVKNNNDVWSTDFKGEFQLGNKKYCYPLTITDNHSRFLISCEALDSTKQSNELFSIFERAFLDYGLPKVIKTDNGNPFSSVQALHGLSRLSVWWLRLGIRIERIRPGHPEENGRHERMHLTLKKETTKPSGENNLQQQEKFNAFINEFNYERPHEALNMKTPSEVYKSSKREYKGIQPLHYPLHDRVIRVTNCGRICIKRKKINLSTVLAGHDIGIREVEDGIYLVSFMDYDIGYFDLEDRAITATENPFGSKVLPMCSV